MATTTNNGWSTPDDTAYVKDGASAIRTLGSAIDTTTGKAFLAWQTYAPTLSGGFTNGNGTYGAARYCQIGKTMHVAVAFTTGNGSKGNGLTISLPAASVATGYYLGVARLTVGGTVYPAYIVVNNNTTATIYVTGTAGTYGNQVAVNGTTNIPNTWAASGDLIHFSFAYEVA